MVGLCSRAALLKRCRRLGEAVGDSAAGAQLRGVEGDVLGQDCVEGGILFGVEQVGEAVAGLSEGGD